MTNKENLEAIMRRVQKLLAIANCEGANPNEAAAAAGMAERIMRKYQLEHADVIMASLKSGDDLATADVVANAKTNGTKALKVPLWAGTLAVAIAKLNDCGARQAWTKENEACVRFYGFSADVQVSKWMFDYLVGTTLRLCADFKKSPAYAIGGRSTVASYRHGVAIGIVDSLTVLLNSKQKEVTSAGTSLVIVKQQAITEKYGDFGYEKNKSKVSRGNAFSNGFLDGKKVDVSVRAINGPAQSDIKLLK